MSKKLLVGNEMKQPSLLGFVSKKSAAEKSPSVFSGPKASQRMLTENGQATTSTPLTFRATATTTKSKFKYVPAKRKSESLIEISDDSRSPTKFENPPPKRTHLIESDDDLFDFDVDTAKVAGRSDADDDVEKKLKAIYAKYDTPKKQQPVKTGAIRLTPEDKLNLDKALSLNDTYTNAQKKLDENLQQMQQSSRLLTTKTGVGKFKFNRPRTSLNGTNDAVVENVGTKQLSSTGAAQPPKPLIMPVKRKPVATVTSNSLQSMPQANIVSNNASIRFANGSISAMR